MGAMGERGGSAGMAGLAQWAKAAGGVDGQCRVEAEGVVMSHGVSLGVGRQVRCGWLGWNYFQGGKLMTMVMKS